MRGYFGIGVEGLSKSRNAGNLFRSAHGFGASFVFTVAGTYDHREGGIADTSDTPGQVPFYAFKDPQSLNLPDRCTLVGIELLDDAVDLPSFRHPRCAAYVLGPERGSLSPAMVAKCEFIVKIPTKFCINVATAGAIVMYDRLAAMGRFAARPVTPHGPIVAPMPHVRGGPVVRGKPG